jgi:hypothetical protein
MDQETATQKSLLALTRISNYYLNQDHLLTLSSELKTQALLAFVSITGDILYYFPASKYSGNAALWLQVSYEAGTLTASLVVLYNATEFFFQFRRSEHIPPELQDILVTIPKWQQGLKNSFIGLGSMVSSIPLAAVVFGYHPAGEPLWLLSLHAGLILFDNTVLHFLPFYLVMRTPLYRFPTIPFEKLFEYMQYCRLNEHQKEIFLKNQRQLAIHLQLKQLVMGSLTRAKNRILLEDFSFDVKHGGYKINPGNVVKLLTGNKEKENNLNNLLALAEYGNAQLPSKELIPYQPSRLHTFFSYVNSSLRYASYCAGAIWVAASCSGYLAEPIKELKTFTGNDAAAYALPAPSLYFFGVILVFFGGNALKDIYNYITSWGENTAKIPLEIKLYPKTFLLLMLANFYLSPFSFAAAEQLVIDNFSDEFWDFIRPTLIYFARTGIPFLSVTAIMDFYKIILKKFAFHFGGDETKMIAQANSMIEQLINGIWLMKGEILQEDLTYLDDDSLTKLTTLTREEFDEMIKLENSQGSIQEEEQPLLVEPKTGAWCCCFPRERKSSISEVSKKPERNTASTYTA